MPKDDVYYVGLIGKTLGVLETLAQGPQRQFSLLSISEQLRMNKNAVFRILYSLAEHGYVVKDDRKYELGPKLVELSNARLRHTDLLVVAGPLLQAMRDTFGETVNLGVLDQNQIRYISVWESHDPLRLAEKVGAVDMLHCSALGKAYLSRLAPEEVRTLLGTKRLTALTEHTITSTVALKAELVAIRKRGFAIDADESMMGACCVACVIMNPEETRPIAAVSVSGPSVRMTTERATETGEALKATVREIQAKLGGNSSNSSARSPSGRSGSPNPISTDAYKAHLPHSYQ
ncbi:MAG TPA: IclR family transcriptional regulator [Acidobacteriaceae bacterium]